MKYKKFFITIFEILLLLFLTKNLFSSGNEIKDSSKVNFIVVAIDALRSDHLGCYGYSRNTSPNIDKLARESVMFTQAIAPGGWTFESVPSLLTGTYSYLHKIQSDSKDLINPSVETVAQLFSSIGYQTALFSNQETIRNIDIKSGFAELYLEKKFQDKKEVFSDQMLTDKIGEWLKEKGKKTPFFIYIHYWGCHSPYTAPVFYKARYLNDTYSKSAGHLPISDSVQEKYDGNGKIPYVVAENNIDDPNYYVVQYDGAVTYLDAQIGQLMQNLKQFGLEEDTVFIVTADHGEMLGDHGIYFTHGGGYEGVLRVPLFIRLPRLSTGAAIVSTQVSLIDIVPTMLEIAGLKAPSYLQGESLLSSFTNPSGYNRLYVLSSQDQSVTVRTQDWKLIYRDDVKSYELYELSVDPHEQYNLAQQKPDKVAELEKRMEEWKEKKKSADLLKDKFPGIMEKYRETIRKSGYF